VVEVMEGPMATLPADFDLVDDNFFALHMVDEGDVGGLDGHVFGTDDRGVPSWVAMIARSLDHHQHCELQVGIQRAWKEAGGERKRSGEVVVVVLLVETMEAGRAQNMMMRLLRLLLRLPPVEADAGQQQDR
jgi:hypothetical protein